MELTGGYPDIKACSRPYMGRLGVYEGYVIGLHRGNSPGISSDRVNL